LQPEKPHQLLSSDRRVFKVRSISLERLVDEAGEYALTSLEGSRGKPVLGEKTRQLMIAPPPEPLRPRENGTYVGLGWDSVLMKEKAFGYYKDGSYQGMRTYMKRLPTGVNWVLLYNASMEFDPQEMQLVTATVRDVHQLVEGIEKHPDIDLFKEYP
jgi:hypothetical protein